MQKFVKKLLITIIPIILTILSFFLFNINYVNTLVKFLIILGVLLLSIICFCFEYKLKNFVRKLILITTFAFSISFFGYNLLDKYDLLKYLSSITAIKELILSMGHKGALIFIFIQISQVVFLPIPAIALLVVGVVIYGPLLTTIFCIIGVLIGSYISFLMGKTFGYKFVSWFIGEQNVKKYSKILNKNGKYILSIVFIFPFFPDDLFCMVAGISSMTFKEFFIITTLIRPISIIIMCFLGGGTLLKLDNITGILIGIIILIITIILLLIIFKKNKRIQTLFLSNK